MNARVVVGLVAAAVVLVLLVFGQRNPPRDQVDEVDPDPIRQPTDPELETHGAPPARAEPVPKAPPPEPVPAAEPERDIDAGGLRVRLSGRVFDPEGRPLPDIPVRAYPYFDSERRGVSLQAEGRTDVDGRFVLDFRPRAKVTTKDPWLRMRVAAFHPTWVMAVANAYMDTRKASERGVVGEDIELRMQPAFRMLCHVRDEDGRPIAGATCALEQFYGRKRFVDGRNVEAVTDESGTARFHLPHIGDSVILLALHGHNAFRVSAPGYATVYARTQVPDSITKDHVSETTVVLPAPYEIRGRLADDTRKPLADFGYSVTGRRKGTWGMLVQTRWADHALRTDEDGGFTIPAVAAGTWRLEFEAEGYRRTRLEAEAGVTDLDVMLIRQAKSVLLFRDVRTKQFLGVQAYSIVYENGASSSTSGGGADTRVELDDIPPGTHELSVRFAGRAQPFETTFVAKPGEPEPVVFDVPPPTGGVTVAGTVTDPEGKPLQHVWMSMEPARPPTEEEGAHQSLQWQTPADGTFRFEGLAAGAWMLELEANGFATRRLDIEIGDAGSIDPLRIALSRGATLRVVFAPVSPEAKWRYDVRLLHESGETVGGRSWGADKKNEVVFAHLPPGEMLVTLETKQFRTRRFEGDPFTRRVVLRDDDETVVSFEDVRTVRVRGSVVGKRGRQVAVGGLQLRRIGPTFDYAKLLSTTHYGNKNALTDEAGDFDWTGILPGRYAVANLTRDGVPVTFEVSEDPIQDLVLASDAE